MSINNNAQFFATICFYKHIILQFSNFFYYPNHYNFLFKKKESNGIRLAQRQEYKHLAMQSATNPFERH